MRNAKGQYVAGDVFTYSHHFPNDDLGGPGYIRVRPGEDTPGVSERKRQVQEAKAGDPGTRTERIQSRNELSTAQGSGEISATAGRAQGALNRQLRVQRGQSLFRRSVPLVGTPKFIGNDDEDLVEKAIRKIRGR